MILSGLIHERLILQEQFFHFRKLFCTAAVISIPIAIFFRDNARKVISGSFPTDPFADHIGELESWAESAAAYGFPSHFGVNGKEPGGPAA